MPDPYFSEIRYQASSNTDFFEIAVDPDYDVTNLVVTVYDSDGTALSTYPVAGLTSVRIGGKDVYVLDDSNTTGFLDLHAGEGVSISDSSTGEVFSFLTFGDGSPITAIDGPANTLTSTSVPKTTGNQSVESTDGTNYVVQPDPNKGVIPCFTLGTAIQTPDGAIRVEELQRGTQVTTASGEAKPLLAIFRRTLEKPVLRQNPKLYPVRVTAGALGQGLPKMDLLVSRQHRLLVASPIVRRMFGVSEALVAAIKLTELPGIYVDTTVENVTYFHLLFDAHEVIYAEGAPTESLFLSAESVRSLPKATLREIAAIFPALDLQDETVAPGRFIPSGRQQKTLIARHGSHQKALLVDFVQADPDAP